MADPADERRHNIQAATLATILLVLLTSVFTALWITVNQLY